MNYVPLTTVYFGPQAANINGQSCLEPNWGLGRAGWYLVDETGKSVFGPFDDEAGALEELAQLRNDLERGIA
jgi:hypothetical protein